MRRVMIIGSPGAGKSTLARKLAPLTHLPLLHLDQHYWLPGWIEREPEIWQNKLSELAAAESWIIDGNYGDDLAGRVARADMVVWLDYSTRICLWRLFKRTTLAQGRVLPDAAPGCPESFEFAFFWFVATFRKRKRPAIVAALRDFTGVLMQFRHPREADRWLSDLAARRL